MRTTIRQLGPIRGTIIFAVLFFFARLGMDWLFRWWIPDISVPPLWTVFLTLGVGTAIASFAVFLLLTSLRREFVLMRELNHELRNALQVMTYALPHCDQESRTQVDAAINRVTSTLTTLSHEIGMEHSQSDIRAYNRRRKTG